MLHAIASCFRKRLSSVGIEEPMFSLNDADYDQENAINLFYDMCIPTVVGMKGKFLLRQEFRHIYTSSFVTRANRDICLNIIKLQIGDMVSGEIKADSTARAYALKYAPKLNVILSPYATLAARLQAMMAWAAEDPDLHAALLYEIYDLVFARRSMQAVPSLRLGVPRYLIDAHGEADALRIWRNSAASSGTHPSGFERYRNFIEAIWIPYLAQHNVMGQAVLDELHMHGPAAVGVGDDALPQPYMELGEAMGFTPAIRLNTDAHRLEFSYCIKCKVFEAQHYRSCFL